MIKTNFLEKILSIIYTRRCFSCKSLKEDRYLCGKCRKQVRFFEPGVYKELNGSKVYACTHYEGIIKKLIFDFKYNGRKYLAQVFAELMFEYFNRLGLKENFLIISVPIHKKRLKERRFNHMDLAAKEFSRLSGFQYNTKLLLRVKDTEKQFKLHKSERRKNMQGAFALNEKEIPDLNTPLLVIDDITSSGITLEEIIKLLKSSGCNNITAITLAAPDLKNKKTSFNVK